ncbi:RsfA family transcriptional regulator [Siminovitchia acidinfaciens]|uniref:RsfA family transcriptional regulator n=1 Tax=Siminovitchia acidinfaciens TaxID=2321395 RepID=A0A429Y6F1_9BACI|nr:RsfA family transcriptional regulator [Siminovitchia acidinfaciens]RST77029.1 RsfA family transcriptional regulator [Siminovitchia acidinfaciens]
MKTRQDAWTEENDLLLAETVLRHVREGSTQLNAFEEVGDRLNRTSAACGFRWNAVVRQQYEKALDLAKKQRKQRQRLLGKEQSGKKKLLYQPPVPSLQEIQTPVLDESNEDTKLTFNQETSMDNNLENFMAELASEPGTLLPAFTENQSSRELNLGQVIAFLQQLHHSEFHADILRSENERLRKEVNDLSEENKRLKTKVEELEDSSVTMQEDYETLMKILNRARKLVLFDEEERPASTFKMDRNGNLEKMAE